MGAGELGTGDLERKSRGELAKAFGGGNVRGRPRLVSDKILAFGAVPEEPCRRLGRLGEGEFPREALCLSIAAILSFTLTEVLGTEGADLVGV